MLNEIAPNRDSIIATDAAGAIKYYSGLPVIDILGLNDIHIAHKEVALGKGVAGHEKQDNSYVLKKNPLYITTWLDKDDGAGRGFRQWFEFRSNYELRYLLDTSSNYEHTNRIEHIAPTSTGYCTIAPSANLGSEPIYDWAVWERVSDTKSEVRLFPEDFRSNIDGVLKNCRDDELASLSDTTFKGIFLYGPYFTFPSGEFTVKIRGRIMNCSSNEEKAVVFEVFDGKEVVSTYSIEPHTNDTRDFEATLDFSSMESTKEKNVEFRAVSGGVCSIVINGIFVSDKSRFESH